MTWCLDKPLIENCLKWFIGLLRVTICDKGPFAQNAVAEACNRVLNGRLFAPVIILFVEDFFAEKDEI